MAGPYLLPQLRGRLAKEHELFKALLAQLPPLAAFRQNFYPSVTNWLPFYWQGFRQTTHYTYRLTAPHSLPAREAALDADIRRDLRKARQQVQVVHSLEPTVMFRLLNLSFERQGLGLPCSWQQFERLDAALARHEARRLFFAVDAAGRVHSAAMLIWDQTCAYYHLAGDDPALRKAGRASCSSGKPFVTPAKSWACRALILKAVCCRCGICTGPLWGSAGALFRGLEV